MKTYTWNSSVALLSPTCLRKLFSSLCSLINKINLMIAEKANYLVSSLIADYRIAKLLSYIFRYMVYKRIKGSHQIGNYLAGHVPPNRKLFGETVPPNRKLFGGTVPPNRKLFGRTVPPNSLPR